MDSQREWQPQPTDNSSEDETEILASPIESGSVLIATDPTANSSLGQQSNLAMTQVEVDGLLQRISLEVQRLNADLSRKVSESPEFQRLREELREKDAKLVETQLRLIQCESDKSKFAQMYEDEKIKLERFQRETLLLAKCKPELEEKSPEIVRLEAQLQQQQNLNEELKRKSKEELTKAESLQWQYLQLYVSESGKLKSVEQQLELETKKNRQKDLQLAELQNQWKGSLTEYLNRSGEIRKLRLTAKSLRTQLRLKSDEILVIKSAVKSVLDVDLNCSICLHQMTEAVVTECGHTFCKDCIDQWINRAVTNNTGRQKCPNCRAKCYRSAPVVAIQQLQAKLISSVNAERPIITQSTCENLPSGSKQQRHSVNIDGTMVPD